MPHDIDSRLATAAVLAHGALNSLSLLKHAYDVLDRRTDKSDWPPEVIELVAGVPEQIDLMAEHLRFIVTGSETTPAVDALDRLSPAVVDEDARRRLEDRIQALFDTRLQRPLTTEEQQEYVEISAELTRPSR